MLPSDGVSTNGKVGGYAKQDYIDILNEEVESGLLSHLLSTHEDYLVRSIDYPLSNVNGYAIPERAIGNKLRGVFLLDSNSNIYEMTRIDLSDITDYQENYSYNASMVPFQILDNKVVFPNTSVQNAIKIRMYYYLRPSDLVEDKFGAVIQAITVGATTTDFLVNKVPTTFSASSIFDITGHKTPSRLHVMDITPITVNANTKVITLNNSDIPTDVIVGDYITLAQESIVPQVPTELHPLLAQRAAVAVLEALGDTEGLANARTKLTNMESKTVDLIDNRSETNSQKINNKNSPLRRGRPLYRHIR
jgi:hypothetical protein